MKVHIKLLIPILVCIMLILGGFIYIYFPNKVRSEISHTPIVFVHGYKGTINSFQTMIQRFEENGWGQKKLIMYVSPEGKIRDYLINKEKSNQTFVQIILEDNRASFADSTKWLAEGLRYLKVKYNVEQVHLVGHSMGGIISVKYMQIYQIEDFPKVVRFVAIGSPFNGIDKAEYFHINRDPAAMDLKTDSKAIQQLQAERIPEMVSVLNIGSTGDSIANPDSVKAIRKMVLDKQLKEIIIADDNLGHSDLHESSRVDKIIHSFLWQDEIQ